MTRKAIITWIGGGLLSAFGLASALLFHQHYWTKRGCFNGLGRCWDGTSQTVYLAQSGLVWGGMASVLLLSGIALLWFGGSRR